MATYSKITDLTAATAITSGSVFEVADAGASKQVTASVLAAYTATDSALTGAFSPYGPSGVTGATAVRTFIFDGDAELDYSSSFTDGQTSAVTTITELPSTTTAILFYIYLKHSGTNPSIGFKVSAGSAVETLIGATFEDVGINYFRTTAWVRSDGNSVYVVRVVGDTDIQVYVYGYMTKEE